VSKKDIVTNCEYRSLKIHFVDLNDKCGEPTGNSSLFRTTTKKVFQDFYSASCKAGNQHTA
jgi:hypothetical protein